MSTRLVRVAIATTLMATVAVPLGIAPAHARTDSTFGGVATLPLDTAADLISVGGFTEKLVVAGYRPGDDALRTGAVVVDAHTGEIAPVGDLTEVTAVALSDDRTVYATVYHGGVALFSVDDPGSVHIVPTGDADCLHDLAVGLDRRAYVVAGCDVAHQSLLIVDPATNTTTVFGAVPSGTDGRPDQLANTNQEPDILALVAPGRRVDLLDVSGASPVRIGSIAGHHPTAAQTVYGGNVAVGFAGGSVRMFEISAHPIAYKTVAEDVVADSISFDGLNAFLAVTGADSFTTFETARWRPLTYYLPDASAETVASAWVGYALFSLTADPAHHLVVLRRHSDAWKVKTFTTATLSAPPRVGMPVILSGRMTALDGEQVYGAPLVITRSDRTASDVPIAVVEADDRGRYSISVVPRDGFGVIYRAAFAGTAQDWNPSSATWSGQVTRRSTFLSIGTDHTDYRVGDTAHVTAHLGHTYTNSIVAIYATHDGVKRLLARGPVGADGKLHADDVVRGWTYYSAEFTGDLRYDPAYVRVRRPGRD